MALHVLGTTTANALQCIPNWDTSGGVISAKDIAAIDQSIVFDGNIGASILSGVSFGATASVCTGSTNSNTFLSNVTQVSTTVGVPVTQIQVGDIVLGRGIPAGTFVAATATSGTTITITNSATTTSASTGLIFVRLAATDSNSPTPGALGPASPISVGYLDVPGRGRLKVLPGDVVAIDNTGWPILVSGNSIAYTSSVWSLV